MLKTVTIHDSGSEWVIISPEPPEGQTQSGYFMALINRFTVLLEVEEHFRYGVSVADGFPQPETETIRNQTPEGLGPLDPDVPREYSSLGVFFA